MPNNPSAAQTSVSRDLPTYTIKVEGQALTGTLNILAIRVQKEVNRLPTAHITLIDGEPATGKFEAGNADTFTPGKKIDIFAGYHGDEKIIFKGIIVKHGIELRVSGTTRLNIMCKDAFVKTTMVTKRKYFTDKKDNEVADDIVQTYAGLEIDAEATTVTHKELIQYDATDWDFIISRAEANGRVCFIDDGKMTIAKPLFSTEPIVSLQYGATILDFDAEMDARDQNVSVKTTTWDYADQALIEADAAEPSITEQGNFTASDVANALGAEAILQHVGKVPQEELQAWSDAILLKQRMAKIRGRVRFYGNADVKPGAIISLGGLSERFNGKAWVSGVNHRFEEGGWTTDVQFGLSPTWFIKEFDIAPPQAAGLLPPLSSLQIGVVTGLEGDPDSEERIMVRLPMIDAAGDGSRARIMSLDAGNKRGFYFRPEIGDEVVVGFLNNDPREAIILGGLHSSNKPVPTPFETKDTNHLKGYVSRSEMQMVFDDEKKIFTLKTPAGNQFVLDEDKKNILIEDQNGNKITMSSDGISIESSKDLVLKAKKDINLEGVNIEQKASAQFKAEGSAGIEVSSSATAVLKGSIVQIN
jgi:Rhs element Vgr protein